MQDRVILVVEDDPTLQLVVKMAIGQLGMPCEVVSSGEAALQKDLAKVGLIFMDIGLPGMQGNQVSLLIREMELRERRKRVPIIALTGHAREDQCLLAGMDDYLRKPAMIDDFKRIIAKWMPSTN